MTEFGEVELAHKLYQADGADALSPLDAAMELPDEKLKRTARRMGVEITIVLDIVHVIEYLWSAAYAFHPEGNSP
jgi:hypothetical protein